MKIEKYSCDLCGAPMNTLDNMEELHLSCNAENYHQDFTYYVCPFCAATFKSIDNRRMEKLLLDNLQPIVDKT